MIPRLAKKLFALSALTLVGLGVFFVFSHSALAQSNASNANVVALGLNTDIQTATGLGNEDIRITIAKIIRVALTLLGTVAVVLMVYAGYLWMTAGGNDEQIDSAKKVIKNAVIGLVIILCSYAIVSFVINKLLEATTGLPAYCFDGDQSNGEYPFAPCGTEDPTGDTFDQYFYITTLPAAGDACVANFHPMINFNHPADITTFTEDAIRVEKLNGDIVVGSWVYVNPNSKNMVKFVPKGFCGNTPETSDCFEPNTDYTLKITDAKKIKSYDLNPINALPLKCDLGKRCGPVSFKTGNGVDTKAPTVTIVGPNNKLEAGTTVPVQVDFTDDIGVRSIILNKMGRFKTAQAASIKAGRATSAVSGDFTGDGLADVLVGAYGNFGQLFTGDGSGKFTITPSTVTFGAGGVGTGLITTDFNGDSILDVVQYSGFTKNLNLVLGNGINKKGDGTFKTGGTIVLPMVVTGGAAADLNKDGFMDLVVSGFDTNLPAAAVVYLGKGNGTFQNPVLYNYGTRGGPVVVANFTNDSIPDILIADNYSKNVSLLIGKGDGTFTVPTTALILPSQGVSTMDVGDLNNDGKLDLAVGFTSPGNRIFTAFGKGDGTFTNLLPYPTSGNGATKLAFKDFNQDGAVDIALSNLYSNNIGVFYNKGNGTLLPVDLYTLPANGYDMLVGDFNSDGLNDIIGIAGDVKNAFPAINLFTGTSPEYITSETIEGCVPSGRLSLPWKTHTTDLGNFVLNAIAVDATQSASDLHGFTLLPGACFDSFKDPGEDIVGPPACGATSVCGQCPNTQCTFNQQCAGGKCVIVAGQSVGVCVNIPQITDFSPKAAGKDSFVTVSGYYFGSKTGRVSFALKSKPDPTVDGDWKDAVIVSCGGYSGWTDRQIIVQVPDGIAAEGPIRVITSASNVGGSYTDTTQLRGLPNFEFTKDTLPGICAIEPPVGGPGKNVLVKGKGFESLNSADDFVSFGLLKGVVGQIVGGQVTWTDLQINTTVPNLDRGFVGVTVTVNGKTSNSFQFEVLDASDVGKPIITNITPTSGPKGQYMTIEGSGFGTKQGYVWFKEAGGEALAPAEVFDFPEGFCSATDFWRDNRIIAKFPKSVAPGDIGKSFFVQVQPEDRSINASPLDERFKYELKNGEPSPGLCSITPRSGLVPFTAPQVATLNGEYFTGDTLVYYNKLGATSDATTGALATKGTWAQNQITVSPIIGTISGRVVAYRQSDKTVSNPLQFETIDCTTVGNKCDAASDRCCVEGSEKGFCKPANQLCAGEKRSTGYVWRFSTKDIPEVPRVYVSCDDDGVRKDVTIPSPSPNIRSQELWRLPAVDRALDPQYNVCRQAISYVEFTTKIDPATVLNNENMEVYRCTNVNKDDSCAEWAPANINPASYQVLPATASHSLIKILPPVLQNGVAWDDNTWYQVVLKKTIKSNAAPEDAAFLAPDAPCDDDVIKNSAYCFKFRTGQENCNLRAVIVNPYKYFTTYLEAPMLERNYKGEPGGPLPYSGNGLSTQRCIMMDMSGYNWDWAGSLPYADINDSKNSQTSHVSSLQNTVGVTQGDSVDIAATASKAGVNPQTGVSPLTIDLSTPKVLEAWPNCVEACTNAEVGVRFNMTMNNLNLPGSPTDGTVQLLECEDENCRVTNSVFTVQNLNSIHLDPATHYTVLKIANDSAANVASPVLKPDTKYKVIISTVSDPKDDSRPNQLWASYKYNDPSKENIGKKFNEAYTYTFKTKKEACQIDRVAVSPKDFFAKNINDRSIFSAQPYSAPDACSAEGQKLNPRLVNWAWQTDVDKPNVATIEKFSSRTASPSCTAQCIRKGSDIASTDIPESQKRIAICGNGVVEAGEDCDNPSKDNRCSLDCRYMGSVNKDLCGNGKLDRDAFFGSNGYGEQCDPKDPATMINCSADCRRLGSDPMTSSTNPNLSICGNGLVNGKIGSGEDCDLGVAPDVRNPLSSLNCSAQCLHKGTTLAKRWCTINRAAVGDAPGYKQYAGFTKDEFDTSCGKALSICGDGYTDLDEDTTTGGGDCDIGGGKHSDLCDDRCLLIRADSQDDVANGNSCGVDKDNPPAGCNEFLQHVGSSILYTKPSVCGDGVVGAGEDATCEAPSSLTGKALIYDPWVVAIGVGKGAVDVSKEPPEQSTKIIASTKEATKNNATISGSGNFTIQCGYKTDADCASAAGPGFGVASNSCCYARPELVSTFPATSTIPQSNVCPNTYLAATFNQKIDVNSLSENILIAVGQNDACAPGLTDVTKDVVALGNTGPALAWYQSAFQKIANFVKSLFGSPAEAVVIANPKFWCVGADVGTPTVEEVPGFKDYSRVKIKLSKPLTFDVSYAIILKSEVKNDFGVRLSDNKSYSWQFSTGSNLCEVNSVNVTPSSHLFSAAGSKQTFSALAAYVNPQNVVNYLQPIAGYYDWNFAWGPTSNDYVTFASPVSTDKSEVTALNRNGEIDIRAAANITQNTISATKGIVASGISHITVFLCENPWPPKSQMTPGGGPFVIFPYEDKFGNNDRYSFGGLNQFDGETIQPSKVVSDGYFNFRTYYCADAGAVGKSDDLPYMRPSVQYQAKDLATLPSTCALTGDNCTDPADPTKNLDCGIKFTTTTQVFVAKTNKLCASVNKGMASYFVDSKNKALSCTVAADCDPGSAEFVDWKKSVPGTTACFDAPALNEKNACYAHRPLKRFLFTSDKSSDTIGIQVFENREFLTAKEWFEGDARLGGQGFKGAITNTKIDGYDAVTDGNNYYVEGLNMSMPGNGTNNLYGTVYLLSINANARPETRKVFDLMRDNFKLNINLTNARYCGASNTNPGFDKQCKTDLDCPGGQVCSAQKDKLQRSYLRLRAIQTIEQSLKHYYDLTGGYPNMASGSFLAGQTISTWPQSWTLLSNTAQAIPPFPVDPINQLGPAGTCASNTTKYCLDDSVCGQKPAPDNNIKDTCLLHDPATGWSTENRRFSFACSPASLAYRYIFSKDNDYEIRIKPEEFGLDITNYKDLARVFDPYKKMVYNPVLGICDSAIEVRSNVPGYCGDGVLDASKEACDPPKSSSFGVCGADGQPGQMKVDVCSDKCLWIASTTSYTDKYTGLKSPNGFVSCSYASVCGNGIKETGETCDQGKLNGTFNSCATDCKGYTNTCGNNKKDPGELCEITDITPGSTKDGWCVDGLAGRIACADRSECTYVNGEGDYNGYCVSTKKSGVKYAIDQADSCGFDCRSRGPYCGDGIIQPEFGEECDGNDNSCKIAGVAGVRECSNECKYLDKKATAQIRFDDIISKQGQKSRFPSAIVGGKDAVCNPNDCPEFGLSDGKYNGGVTFYYDKNFVQIPHDPSIAVPTSFSLSFWINPEDYPLNKPVRVLEKGGFNIGAGYSFDIYYGTPVFSVSKDKNGSISTQPPQPPLNPAPIPANKWSHVVAVYDKQVKANQTTQSLKVYVNGKLVTEKLPAANLPDWVAVSNNDLFIGRSSDPALNVHFNGGFDEFEFLPYAMQPAEVVERYGNPWACNADVAQIAAATPKGICGDGIVDDTEACDKGVANEDKCTPSYNQSCSYCTKDCLVATVEPVQYCGNGIIEATEQCDTDLANNSIYMAKSSVTSTFPDKTIIGGVEYGYLAKSCNAEQTDPYTAKGGTKICSKCQSIVNKDTGRLGCAVCGLTQFGEKISGGIVNVLLPNIAGVNADNFFSNTTLKLWMNITRSTSQNIAHRSFAAGTTKYTLTPSTENSLTSNVEAVVGSDISCVNPSGIPSYFLDVNTNNADGTVQQASVPNFAVQPDPKNLKPWRYDLVLSPIMSLNGLANINVPTDADYGDNNAAAAARTNNFLPSQTARPNDMRLVLSWEGEGSLVAGLMYVPFQSLDPVVVESNNGQYSYGPLYSRFRNTWLVDGKSLGIWNHNYANTVNGIKTHSFTVDRWWSQETGKMAPQYMYYVRTADKSPISNYSLKNVKVQIYLPKDSSNANEVDIPYKEIYLSDAGLSESGSASYWHVLNINRVDLTAAPYDWPRDPITNDSVENGRIVSSKDQLRTTRSAPLGQGGGP